MQPRATNSALLLAASISIAACVQILNVDEYTREAPPESTRRRDSGQVSEAGPEESNADANAGGERDVPGRPATQEDVRDSGASPGTTNPASTTPSPDPSDDAGAPNAANEVESAYTANVEVAVDGREFPNAAAVYVGAEQCDKDFKFTLTGYDPALLVSTLELWVASGTTPVDCNLATNRTGAAAICWLAGSVDSVTGRVQTTVNGRRLFNRDPTATSCPSDWHTNYTVWFVPLPSPTQSSPSQPSAALDVQLLHATFSVSNLVEPGATTFFVYDGRERRGRGLLHDTDGSATRAGPWIDNLDSAWTHVVELHNRALLFYDSGTGRAQTARLNAAGEYDATVERAVTPDLAPNWTHVVSVRENGLFFYNARELTAMTASVGSDGTYSPGHSLAELNAWTHVAGTVSGAMFFYAQPSGTGATGGVDAALRYTGVSTHSALSKAWTHVTSARSTVLFYDSNSGRAYAVEILGSRYQRIGAVDGIAAGFEQFVGSANGTLLLLDGQTNSAEVGALWLERTPSMLKPHYVRAAHIPDLAWTHASAN